MSQTTDSSLIGEWRLTKISINGKLVFDAENPELFINSHYRKGLKNAKSDNADSTELHSKSRIAAEAMSHSYYVFESDNDLRSGVFFEDEKGASLLIFPGSYQTDGQKLRMTLFKKTPSNEEYLFEVTANTLLLKVRGNEANYFEYRRILIQ